MLLSLQIALIELGAQESIRNPLPGWQIAMSFFSSMTASGLRGAPWEELQASPAPRNTEGQACCCQSRPVLGDVSPSSLRVAWSGAARPWRNFQPPRSSDCRRWTVPPDHKTGPSTRAASKGGKLRAIVRAPVGAEHGQDVRQFHDQARPSLRRDLSVHLPSPGFEVP